MFTTKGSRLNTMDWIIPKRPNRLKAISLFVKGNRAWNWILLLNFPLFEEGAGFGTHSRSPAPAR